MNLSLVIRLILLFFAFGSLSCSSNILEDFADTDSAEAIIADVEEHINDQDYDSALASFQTLSATDQATRDNQVLLAKIYAGQCGLDFLGLSEDITGIGSNTLLVTLMGAFPGATSTEVTACINAESTILGIDNDGSNRTTQENLLMAYIAWTKMGTILSLYADTDDDGSTDGGFDPCDSGDLPQTEAQHMATGLANMLDGLGNIGSSDVGGDQLSGINALCTLIDTVNTNFNFCNSKVITDVNANQEQGIRSIVTEARDLGLGANGCVDGIDSGLPCVCP